IRRVRFGPGLSGQRTARCAGLPGPRPVSAVPAVQQRPAGHVHDDSPDAARRRHDGRRRRLRRGYGWIQFRLRAGLRQLRLSNLSAADARLRVWHVVWISLLIRPRAFDRSRYLASLNRSPKNTWRTASLATISRGLPSNKILPE